MKKKRPGSRAVLIMFILSGIMVIALAIYVNSMMGFAMETMGYNIEQRLISVSRRGAELVTVEELNNYREPADMELPEYQALRQKLADYAEEAEVLYVYYLRLVGDELQFIVDNDFDPETQVGLATPPTAVSLTPGVEKALAGTAFCAGLGHYTVGWDGIMYSMAPVFDENGGVAALCGVDITDKKITTTHNMYAILIIIEIFALAAVFVSGVLELAKFRREAGRAVAANQNKTTFLAQMSHEIRTPMNAIIGMCELAARDDIRPETAEYIGEIKRAGASLLSIINDILDYSKIESGKLELANDTYEVASLLNDALNIIRIRLTDKPIELITEIDADMPGVMTGDETRVRQVLLNILSNAVKYTRKGTIRFSVSGARAGDGRVLLKCVVADTGIGIKKEDMGMLFGEFARVDRKNNSAIEGTGLGLSITRNLCRAMGGDITVESEYGKGSVFTATMLQGFTDGKPLGFIAVNAYSGTARTSVARFTVPDARVLIVDDIATNLKVAAGLIAPYEMIVDTCENGAAAVELVRENAYDIIFMDHMMPEMDGVEATARIRALPGGRFTNVPIIALTANAMSGMREMFLQSGFNDYLSKPIDMVKLDEIIERWIPKERRVKAARKNSEQVLQADNDVLSKLNIDGLDIKRGVGTMGGAADKYIEVLKLYCADAEKRFEALREQPNEETLTRFVTQVHALKSASANVGALSLSKQAELLEAAGKRGDLGEICRRKDKFLQELTELVERVRAALALAETQNFGDGRAMTADDLPLLRRLKTALLSENVGTADETLEALGREPLGATARQTLENVADRILMLEFAEAADIVSAAIVAIDK